MTKGLNEQERIYYSLELDFDLMVLNFVIKETMYQFGRKIVVHRFKSQLLMKDVSRLLDNGIYERTSKISNLNERFKTLKDNPVLRWFIEIDKDKAVLIRTEYVSYDVLLDIEDWQNR